LGGGWFYYCVAAGKDQPLVAVVESDQVGRAAVGSADLGDLAAVVMRTDLVAVNAQLVAY
jgi:hypothetical protein